jgi:beta-phosphoglucomutase
MASFEIILRENDKEALYTEDEKLRFITQKNEIYKKLICDFTPDNLFEGVVELFQYLKSNKVQIALASASHNGPDLLRSMGIEDLFDVVVDPGTIEHGKPAPDIFLEAAKQLGIEPTECIGFEDAVAGISAIKAAGMFAVGIGDSNILTEADIVFSAIKMFETPYLTRP